MNFSLFLISSTPGYIGQNLIEVVSIFTILPTVEVRKFKRKFHLKNAFLMNII